MQDFVDRFNVFYYNSLNWSKNKFLGITTLQNPCDVWITQEIISEVKPDIIIECGTHNGGSILVWTMFMQLVNPGSKSVTIDCANNRVKHSFDDLDKHITYLLGSSVNPELVARVQEMSHDKKVVVILDSDHRKEHVLAELEIYGKLVSKNSYMIVQDTNINGHPVLPSFGPGPMEAVQDFLSANDNFVIDESKDKQFCFSFCPNGFLKKIK